MEIKTISDFRKVIRQGPWAWPGGYPLFFVTADGGVLSFDAAKAERRLILESIRDNPFDSHPLATDGWRITQVDINYEDGDLYCDHLGEKIPSAYGSDGEEDAN
jgi:hypothetical protein